MSRPGMGKPRNRSSAPTLLRERRRGAIRRKGSTRRVAGEEENRALRFDEETRASSHPPRLRRRARGSPGVGVAVSPHASRPAARAGPCGRCGEIGDARFLRDICFPCDACFPRDVCFLCDICFPREGSRLPAPASPRVRGSPGVGVAVSTPRFTLRRAGAAPRPLRHGGNTEGCGRESRAVAARSATRVSCETFVSCATFVSRVTFVSHATSVSCATFISRGGRSPSRPGSAVAPMEAPGLTP